MNVEYLMRIEFTLVVMIYSTSLLLFYGEAPSVPFL